MRRWCGAAAVMALALMSVSLVAASAGATTTATATLFAGTGVQSPGSPTGNGGPATSARFYDPSDEAVSSSGTVYIADMKDCQVRQVNNGTITAFAGVGTCATDGNAGSNPLGTLLPTPAASATIGMPTGVAVDSSGNVYIADCTDYTGTGPGCTQGYILKVSGGTLSVLVTPAQIGSPWASDGNGGVAAPWGVRTAGGNVFFSDVVDSVVDEVSSSGGIPTLVAGTGTAGYSGNGGTATSAQLNDPTGLFVDSSGNIFIADSKNAAIREVVASNGHIVTIAGTGTQSNTGGTGNGGPATSAELDKPFGVVEDSAGDVYIADYEGFCVREVVDGTISTFAGTCGTKGYNVSSSGIAPSSLAFGGNSLDSPPGGPSNVTLTPGGALLINDYGDNAVDEVVFTTTGAPPAPVTSPSTSSQGYWQVASDGGIFNYGAAQFYGSSGSIHLNRPIVGMATAPGGTGYWLVASDGGIFNYGSAQFYGSAGSIHLNQPIVGMAATPDGKGYWLVASDGGIFNYGDAGFYGSSGAIHLNKPIVGMATTPDGKGYWLVASDGGIFNYGDAAFYGSTGGIHLNEPIVGMAAAAGGGGYWLVASDGGIFNYGDAGFYGSAGSIHLNQPIVGMAAAAGGGGYWLVASDGGIFNYGDAAFEGSAGSIHLNEPVVGMAEAPAAG